MRERTEGRSGDRPNFRLEHTSLIAKADSESERCQSPRAAPQIVNTAKEKDYTRRGGLRELLRLDRRR